MSYVLLSHICPCGRYFVSTEAKEHSSPGIRIPNSLRMAVCIGASDGTVMSASAALRQDSVDAQLIQAPGSGAEQRARDFDRIVGILTDEVMSRFPEGRATLEHVVRSRCCSLVDDHTKMLMASFQQREETGRIRQEAKSRSVRRMHEIQIRQQGETMALLKALKLRSTETLIAKGDACGFADHSQNCFVL